MPATLLAAVSAAALLAAAPPLAISPLALLALAPLFVALRTVGTIARAAGLGWITGAIFHAGLLPWLPATIARTQGIAWPAAGLLFAVFVAAHALQFAIVAAGVAGARSAVGRCTVAAAGWVLVEYAFPQVLPWSLGAILGPHPLLRQPAELAGARGLAVFVVLVNALVAEGAASWAARRAHAGVALGLAALLIAAAAGFDAVRTGGPDVVGCPAFVSASTSTGVARAAPVPPQRASPSPLRAAVVQAGWSSSVPDPREAATTAWADYDRLSRALRGRAELIVWPEAVLPVYLRTAPAWRTRAEALATRLDASVMIGALDRTADGGELGAVYVFTPSLSAVRYKSALVPFGETWPALAAWLPRRWWHLPAPRRSGSAVAIVDAGGRLAPAICVEAIVPGVFNAAVRGGAEVLVDVSDDSWFGSAWEAAQHLEMTRLRAVETRRWLVRASHSGSSAVIDADGTVVAELPYGHRGAIARTVERRRGTTVYARWGDAPLLGAAAAALLVVTGSAAWRACQARSNSSTSASLSARS